jgi:hypothetical protein
MALFSHVDPEFTTLDFSKPVFSAIFTAWLAVLCAYGLVQSARGMAPLVSWIGLTLCAAAPLLFLARTRLLQSQQTRSAAFVSSIFCGLGLALTLAMSYRYGPAAGTAHIWAGITLLAWLVYLRWFSDVAGS